MWSALFFWDWLTQGTFLSESVAIYRGYLVVGVLLAVVAGFADKLSAHERLPERLRTLLGGSLPTVVLWVWFVGWANRIVFLAGLVEPVLSVSLAALAISPIVIHNGPANGSWRTGFANRLLGIQTTLLLLTISLTMLASTVWWNGLGAYALVAPKEDRLIDVIDSFFENSWVYESLSAWIVCVPVIACWIGWQVRDSSSCFPRLAQYMMWFWCLVVAILSANILYTMTIAIIVPTMGSRYELDREEKQNTEK